MPGSRILLIVGGGIAAFKIPELIRMLRREGLSVTPVLTPGGAEFVTPPIDRHAEIRCYLRDPDGYMIEVGQATGALHGELATKRPEDLPG